MSSLETRLAARLILLDEQDRILLFQYEDHDIYNPNEPFFCPFWVMPGGGLKPNETFAEAAIRELWEETGLEESNLSPCVWTRDITLNWRGEVWNHHERFFLLRTQSAAVHLGNMGADELATFQDHRWWSLSELERSDDVFLPRELSQLLSPILRDELPAEPIKLTR